MTKESKSIREKILKGLELSHKRLIQSKKQRGEYLVISKDGEIVKLKASDLN